MESQSLFGSLPTDTLCGPRNLLKGQHFGEITILKITSVSSFFFFRFVSFRQTTSSLFFIHAEVHVKISQTAQSSFLILILYGSKETFLYLELIREIERLLGPSEIIR